MNWKILAVAALVSLGTGSAAQAGSHHGSGAIHQGGTKHGNGGSQAAAGPHGGFMCSGCFSGHSTGNHGHGSRKPGNTNGSTPRKPH